MGIEGFNTAGRTTFSEALRYTRLRQTASNQNLPWEQRGLPGLETATPSERQGLPGQLDKPLVPTLDIDGAAHGTLLNYLYAAMLTGQRSYAEAREGTALRGLEALSVDDGVYDALFRPDLVREALAGAAAGRPHPLSAGGSVLSANSAGYA